MKKTYKYVQSFGNRCVCAFGGEKQRFYVCFEKEQNNDLIYETDEESVQQAIESSEIFKSGIIECVGGATKAADTKAAAIPPAPVFYTEFPEVTDFQAAAEVLKGEPYNVLDKDLATPAKIKAAAKKNLVSFSNLKED
jgi:hypothetical protein